MGSSNMISIEKSLKKILITEMRGNSNGVFLMLATWLRGNGTSFEMIMRMLWVILILKIILVLLLCYLMLQIYGKKKEL